MRNIQDTPYDSFLLFRLRWRGCVHGRDHTLQGGKTSSQLLVALLSTSIATARQALAYISDAVYVGLLTGTARHGLVTADLFMSA